ncbi:protein mono-ADP-ribosyltransferase PARP11-like [Clarias gariepinus]|uniref:protein mono-ADP-ribosyltransferase PARP11-like n=1 Tax=Clarias gariepinus TaxID=13013 RepID=UPI00234DD765|nr:protein mono-ADP-ribosyltransferase PARP11-like [Clarias gariepinus]
MLAGYGGQDYDTNPRNAYNYPWYWFYEAESGVWHRTEDDPVIPISSSELEMVFAKNPYGVININTATEIFKINFSGFLKTNLRTGQAQKLKCSLFINHKIRCKSLDEAPSVPAHWEKMDAKAPYKAFTVDRQTSEFKKVERYVQEIGFLWEPLKCIYRIQNVDLWELYCRKKSQLNRIKGQSHIEERLLFHGTGITNVDSLFLYNFDCRISESVRSGHLYGKGTYFSIHASYSDNNSKDRSQGHRNGTRIMFLARVIVGNNRIGQPGFCKPDGDQIENIHDSCVDNTLYPKTFVIFNSNQIYPKYVLEYGG